MLKRFIFFIFGFILTLPYLSFPGFAEDISFILDQEAEDILYSIITPMFKVSGLNPETLNVYIIKDNSINAFAAKGSSIFIHTGLITKANSVDEIIGVLAHETGHIAGGHISRLYDNMKITHRNTIISTLLGAGAAIATGRADVGMAVMMGGSSASMQGHLAYRRSEENSADEKATQILSKTGYSAKGFLEIMKKILYQEKISMSQDNNSYLRTHPLSSDRVAFLENYISNEAPVADAFHNKQEASFQRMKAKLFAFLGTPSKVLLTYPPANKTVPARYARVIANFRLGELDKALSEINALLKDYPNDQYFYELKGQMLFENGRVAEAIEPYEKAANLAPSGKLIKYGLASALIEEGGEENIIKAINTLEKLLIVDKNNPSAWRLLAVAYGKQGDDVLTSYAMAEYMFGMGDYGTALLHADKAMQMLKKGTPKYLRILDLKVEAERLLKEQKDSL